MNEPADEGYLRAVRIPKDHGREENDRFAIEGKMVREGGYITSGGKRCGNGLSYHFRQAISALNPEFMWEADGVENVFARHVADSFILHNEVGIAGPASSGKTYVAANCIVAYLMIWPENTSVLVSSTTMKMLQLRIFAAIKEVYNIAKRQRPWLPGRVIESRASIAFERLEDDAQDFRNGCIGVACRQGDTFVGLQNYVGLKNDRVVLVADEAHLMEDGFLKALSNMRKGSRKAPFKLIAMGNPKDTTDPLGLICEPRVEDGGWEAYDPVAKTRTWKTRANGGIAVQLCGYDTPNGDHLKADAPFPGIITKEEIEADKTFFGVESIEFTMMNLGIFPQNSIEKRVITITLCESKGAFEEVIWESAAETHRAIGLDAAYSGIGGDRCVLTDLTWGREKSGKLVMAYTRPPIIVPVSGKKWDGLAEDQIAKFCKEYCEKDGILPGQFGLDSTGKGTLVGALGRLWSTNVIPVEFGGQPSDRVIQDKDQKTAKDAYGKHVTELWFASRRLIVSGQMRMLPRDVAREAATRAWEWTKGSTKQDVEPKSATKARLGRSPDLWDSLVVAIRVAETNGFVIATDKPEGVRQRGANEWLERRRNKFQSTRKDLVYA